MPEGVSRNETLRGTSGKIIYRILLITLHKDYKITLRE